LRKGGFRERWREGQQRIWARNRRVLRPVDEASAVDPTRIAPPAQYSTADLQRPRLVAASAEPMRKMFMLPAARARQRPGLRKKARPSLLLMGVATFGAVLVLGLAAPAIKPMLTSATAGEEAQGLTGRASVIDGDTIEINGRRIRFFGVDAPERDQTCQRDGKLWACGSESTAQLKGFIGAQPVTCRQMDTDRYGRAVARCTVAQRDVGTWLVASGWAVDFRRYSANEYDAQERTAKAAKIGLWASSFVMPWDWRAAPAPPQAGATTPVRLQSAPSGNCRIKGNINSKGDRIFHSPGQADYEHTVISESKGERWFCSAADATAAGWRPAAR
jgi:endonuclease YncB( thermonuclease family)